MSEKKMFVDVSNLETIIFGVNRICDALSMGPYGLTAAGILSEGTYKERGTQAYDFLENYFELTAGALKLVAGATAILADGVENGELELSLKGC